MDQARASVSELESDYSDLADEDRLGFNLADSLRKLHAEDCVISINPVNGVLGFAGRDGCFFAV